MIFLKFINFLIIHIHKGQRICIPSSNYNQYNLNSNTNTGTSCNYYTVRSGDTFASLSNNNPTLISGLVTANPNVNGNLLTAGKIIEIRQIK